MWCEEHTDYNMLSIIPGARFFQPGEIKEFCPPPLDGGILPPQSAIRHLHGDRRPMKSQRAMPHCIFCSQNGHALPSSPHRRAGPEPFPSLAGPEVEAQGRQTYWWSIYRPKTCVLKMVDGQKAHQGSDCWEVQHGTQPRPRAQRKTWLSCFGYKIP